MDYLPSSLVARNNEKSQHSIFWRGWRRRLLYRMPHLLAYSLGTRKVFKTILHPTCLCYLMEVSGEHRNITQ